MNNIDYLLQQFRETPTLRAYCSSVLSVYKFEKERNIRFVSALWHRLDRLEKGAGDLAERQEVFTALKIAKLFLVSRQIKNKNIRRSIYRIMFQEYYYFWRGKPKFLRFFE